MTWLRLYTEVRHDRKLRRLPPEQRWLWIVLLTIAKESPKPGWLLVSEDVPMTVDDIADEAAIDIESAKSGIEAFLGLGMLEEVGGSLHVVQWDKRQFVSDNATQRWKKWKGNRQDQQPANVGSTLDQRLNQQPANVEPTVPDYRVQSIIIASKDYKKSMLSASPRQPGNAQGLPTISAPDGAGHVQGAFSEQEGNSCDQVVSSEDSPSRERKRPDAHLQGESTLGERQPLEDHSALAQCAAGHHPDTPAQVVTDGDPITGVTPVPQDASSPKKLPDEIAIQGSSPCLPCSATHPDDDDEKTSAVGLSHDIAPCPPQTSLEPSAPASPDEEPGDDSSPDTECRETEPADPPDPKTEPEHYLTKRKRKLSGWKLETFDEFWKVFSYKKGRAEAADAWLDIPNLTRELAGRIIEAATKEARARQELIAKGRTPKWAQGWLSGRRWEDWEENGTAAQGQDSAPADSDEDPYYSNYRRL